MNTGPDFGFAAIESYSPGSPPRWPEKIDLSHSSSKIPGDYGFIGLKPLFNPPGRIPKPSISPSIFAAGQSPPSAWRNFEATRPVAGVPALAGPGYGELL
jgi:hypothetical protein